MNYMLLERAEYFVEISSLSIWETFKNASFIIIIFFFSDVLMDGN